ncbi:hypothetical protein [Mycolicibacterium baixiangningiae]|uniref:hypothetical protein n=1 Tax=Mycolicibacterium baixiangningiae TaxID=2761578 RepID=UPI0027DA6967|nr:hypothetical protein [Mycolicibacterium baixiangningiae]
MLLVVALAVTVTILVTRDGSDGNSPTPPGDGQASEFASANDTGPVNIITEDPTCEPWLRISQAYADTVNGLGWVDRSDDIPATRWSPEQKKMYDAVSKAMRDAANKAENLVEMTPHRVMRELYEQFLAYTAAFTGRIPNYEPADNKLAVAVDNLSSGLAMLCSAVSFDSASPFAPLLPEMEPPVDVQPPASDLSSIEPFLRSYDPACDGWKDTTSEFVEEARAWRSVSPGIPSSGWTAEQRTSVESATPLMSAIADDFQRLGEMSDNRVFEDFAMLSAQYWRAFVLAVPEYANVDNFLSAAATYIANVNLVACEANE